MLPSLVGLALLGLAHAPAQAGARCGTVDVDRLLRDSSASKLAQQTLSQEFGPRFEVLAPLASVRNRAERDWLDARREGRPEAEVLALKADFDAAAKAEREAARPLQRELNQRRGKALDELVGRLNTVYRRLGQAGSFQILMQQGEKEPVFVLDARAKARDCDAPVDLTAEVMTELDGQR